MYKIEGRIEFIAPVLFNNPTSALAAADAGTGGGKKNKDQKVAEAKTRIHQAMDGSVCIPSDNFKKCLVDGANSLGLKDGRRALAPYLEATVFVEHDLSFGVAAADEIHEHWGRIPPRKGALANIRRPMMKAGRTLDFTLVVFDDRRDEKQLRAALEHAGLYSGLGSWRPKYGRFVVKTWKRL